MLECSMTQKGETVLCEYENVFRLPYCSVGLAHCACHKSPLHDASTSDLRRAQRIQLGQLKSGLIYQFRVINVNSPETDQSDYMPYCCQANWTTSPTNDPVQLCLIVARL